MKHYLLLLLITDSLERAMIYRKFQYQSNDTNSIHRPSSRYINTCDISIHHWLKFSAVKKYSKVIKVSSGVTRLFSTREQKVPSWKVVVCWSKCQQSTIGKIYCHGSATMLWFSLNLTIISLRHFTVCLTISLSLAFFCNFQSDNQKPGHRGMKEGLNITTCLQGHLYNMQKTSRK